MAVETVNEGLSIKRIAIALEAAWELESIADALALGLRGSIQENLALRGLSIRAGDLSRVVMSALDDAVITEDELSFSLTGIRTPKDGVGLQAQATELTAGAAA